MNKTPMQIQNHVQTKPIASKTPPTEKISDILQQIPDSNIDLLKQRIAALETTIYDVTQFINDPMQSEMYSHIIKDLAKNQRFGDIMAIYLIADMILAGEKVGMNKKLIFNHRHNRLEISKLMPQSNKEALIEEFMTKHD